MATKELTERVKKLIGKRPADFWTVKEVALLIVKYTGKVSSDDIRFFVHKFTPSAAIIGTALKSLVDDGELIKTESKRTDLKSSHGRGIAIYVSAR